jgi:hypothetical protein
MTLTALCIGGPRDGQIVSVQHGRTMRVPLLTSVLNDADQPFNSVQFVEYRLRNIPVSSDQEILMWIAEGLTTFDAMTRLVEAYAKEAKP